MAILAPDREGAAFLRDVQQSLSLRPKQLPCKYFYDQRGSQLFDQICGLPEYYLTRTELAIMRANVDEMAAVIGDDCSLIEYGSGSSLKTRLLLDAIQNPAVYVPIDISRDHLCVTAAELSDQYPAFEILPVCADYTDYFELPRRVFQTSRRVVYFPGSTIGNFHPREAADFLRRIAGLLHKGSGLLIGVDLQKSASILEPAYDDAQGVTAAFNLNILHRMNRELEADFDTDAFKHVAVYNTDAGRVEMHLESIRDQAALLGDRVVTFAKGERIWTESSYKYALDGFAKLAASAGFVVDRVWLDDERLFSVQYLAVT